MAASDEQITALAELMRPVWKAPDRPADPLWFGTALELVLAHIPLDVDQELALRRAIRAELDAEQGAASSRSHLMGYVECLDKLKPLQDDEERK